MTRDHRNGAGSLPAALKPTRPTSRRPLLLSLALVAGFALAAGRIWCAWCCFPMQEWNDVRLRAAFLIADGLPLYPGLDAGPITTWIYGPVTALVMLPATLASTIDLALLLAATLNAVLVAGSVLFACLLWPAPRDRSWPLTARLGAAAVSLLLLPLTFFIFLQADNLSLACGLIALTCLARALAFDQPGWWWLAAGFAGATAFAKLHGVTLLGAEIGWVWFAGSRPKALRFALKVALAGSVLLLITLAVSATPLAAWQMMIQIPSRLPFVTDWRNRLAELSSFYVLMLLLPAALALLAGWRHRLQASGLGLPVVVWLASVPLGIAGTLTTGGMYNSLHGGFYLIPLALADLGARALARPRLTPAGLIALLLAGLAVLQAADFATVLKLPRKPDTSLALEAVALATQLGPRLWIPWRPLATRFAQGRHDHDEDGLSVRQFVALFPRRAHAFAGLPPGWDTSLLQASGNNWGMARSMQETPSVAEPLGRWIVLRPQPAGVAAPKPATPHHP